MPPAFRVVVQLRRLPFGVLRLDLRLHAREAVITLRRVGHHVKDGLGASIGKRISISRWRWRRLLSVLSFIRSVLRWTFILLRIRRLIR